MALEEVIQGNYCSLSYQHGVGKPPQKAPRVPCKINEGGYAYLTGEDAGKENYVRMASGFISAG